MNLADAIRRASQEAGQPLVPETAPTTVILAESGPSEIEPTSAQTSKMTPESNLEELANFAPEFPEVEMNPFDPMSQAPLPVSPMVTSGTAVRLELFLSPDQLTTVLRAVMEGQHNVLTLREAASYLRIPTKTLESMASEGQVPGFQIDGRWRFAKPALDEWMALRAMSPEEGAHAA